MRDILTNRDKILFPKSKITKEEYFNYYKKIAKKMLPLIKNRQVSLIRFPNGIKGQKFVQKQVSEYYPKWIKTVSVKREGKSNIKMAVINDIDSLLYIANQVGEIHIWPSKIDKPNYPDRMIFDLDPSGKDFKKVIDAAIDLKKLLTSLKLSSFLMTSGSKGLHIIVPIKRELPFEKVREVSKKIASQLVEKYPQKYTIEVRKNKRGNKVFIDYLRNSFAQTSIAPFAIRAIENAPIAAPINFTMLSKINASSFLDIKNFKAFSVASFSSMETKQKSIKNI